MRLFTVLVIDQLVRGTGEVTSPPEFNDVLDKARDLVYEIEVEEAGGTSPTLSFRRKESNSGRGFTPRANLVTAQSLDTLPFRDVKVQAGPLGALGQAAVQLGGTTPTARVRVWATGWSA